MKTFPVDLFDEGDINLPKVPCLNMSIENVEIKMIGFWLKVCATKGIGNNSIPFGLQKDKSASGGKCIVYKCTSRSCNWSFDIICK